MSELNEENKQTTKKPPKQLKTWKDTSLTVWESSSSSSSGGSGGEGSRRCLEALTRVFIQALTHWERKQWLGYQHFLYLTVVFCGSATPENWEDETFLVLHYRPLTFPPTTQVSEMYWCHFFRSLMTGRLHQHSCLLFLDTTYSPVFSSC